MERVHAALRVLAVFLDAVPYGPCPVARHQLYILAPFRAEFHEEELDCRLVVPLVHPHDLSVGMVHHDEHVLVPLAVAGLVNAYVLQSVKRVTRCQRDCVLDPARYLAHAPPRYPHVT